MENLFRAGPVEPGLAGRNAGDVREDPGAACLAWGGDRAYVEAMSEAPSNHELSERLVALEERMNTVQAEYRTDIARLAEDMAKREAREAERDATARWWQTAIALAGFGVATAVILAGIGVATTIIINYLPG